MKTQRMPTPTHRAGGIIQFFVQIILRLRRGKPRASGVRPEVAALIERNMDERPDLWADLA